MADDDDEGEEHTGWQKVAHVSKEIGENGAIKFVIETLMWPHHRRYIGVTTRKQARREVTTRDEARREVTFPGRVTSGMRSPLVFYSLIDVETHAEFEAAIGLMQLAGLETDVNFVLEVADRLRRVEFLQMIMRAAVPRISLLDKMPNFLVHAYNTCNTPMVDVALALAQEPGWYGAVLQFDAPRFYGSTHQDDRVTKFEKMMCKEGIYDSRELLWVFSWFSRRRPRSSAAQVAACRDLVNVITTYLLPPRSFPPAPPPVSPPPLPDEYDYLGM